MQLRNDEEIRILTLRCQLNNHGLTGHLEGTRDNRQQEGCKEGDSCWLQDQNIGGNNTLSLMDLVFDYGGSVMGFCGPGFYHVMGKMMRLTLRLGGGR